MRRRKWSLRNQINKCYASDLQIFIFLQQPLDLVLQGLVLLCHGPRLCCLCSRRRLSHGGLLCAHGVHLVLHPLTWRLFRSLLQKWCSITGACKHPPHRRPKPRPQPSEAAVCTAGGRLLFRTPSPSPAPVETRSSLGVWADRGRKGDPVDG